MTITHLPDLSEKEICDIVNDQKAETWERQAAMMSAVRNCDPDFSLPLLLEAMRRNDHDIALPGFSLMTMEIKLHGLKPDLTPFYEWADRFLDENPDQEETIFNEFEWLPGAKWLRGERDRKA